MKVLVTGATGFVGCHIVAAIVRAGHEPKLLVRDRARVPAALGPLTLSEANVEVAEGDIADPDAVRHALAGCDAVVNAAGIFKMCLPLWRRGTMVRTNVDGAANIIGTAVSMGMDPIIHVSSEAAILQSTPSVLNESAPVSRSPDPYQRSKAKGEAIARRFQDQGAPVVITYPSWVIGPHDPHWGEGPYLFEGCLKSATYRSPEGIIALCDVRDAAELHARLLQPGKGPRRYLVPSHNSHMSEFIQELALVTGRELRYVEVPKRLTLAVARTADMLQGISPLRLPVSHGYAWALTRFNAYDASLAEHDLAIHPRPLRESVRDTLVWMASQGRLNPSLFGQLASI